MNRLKEALKILVVIFIVLPILMIITLMFFAIISGIIEGMRGEINTIDKNVPSILSQYQDAKIVFCESHSYVEASRELVTANLHDFQTYIESNPCKDK